VAFKQMTTSQQIKSQPDDAFIDFTIKLMAERPRDLCGRISAVTALPNKGGRLVKAVCAISLEIINQHFVRQLLNHEALSPGNWFCH
jgi:hypothetical protein